MEKKVNVITLGDSGVGKTSIIKRIKEGIFDDKIKATINNDIFFIRKPYKTKNLTILLTFYDTIGQEIYMNLLPLQYIRNSHIVLLVFDSIETFKILKKRWFEFYQKNTNTNNPKFILVGNKSDLFGDKREEIINLGEEFSEEIDAHFITCSAKSSDNIDNLERYIITEAKRFIDEEEKNNNIIEPIPELTKTSSIVLKKKDINKEGIIRQCINQCK